MTRYIFRTRISPEEAYSKKNKVRRRGVTIFLALMQRLWKVISRNTKPMKQNSCSRMEARNWSRPDRIWEALLDRFATRAAPLAVRTPIMASRPTKVDITRPGCMGAR